jgi:hypothetical protein
MGLRLPGPWQSSDMEEACRGHVINGPRNSWLSLYVLN